MFYKVYGFQVGTYYIVRIVRLVILFIKVYTSKNKNYQCSNIGRFYFCVSIILYGSRDYLTISDYLTI